MKPMQLLCNDRSFKAPSLIVIIWNKLGRLAMSNSLVTELLRALNQGAGRLAEQDSQISAELIENQLKMPVFIFLILGWLSLLL